MDLATKPQPSAYRTILTTAHAFDAGLCGFDQACDPGQDGGFSVAYDGRFSIPSLVINGSDGEVAIYGLEAIQAFADACMDAARLARRQMGVM